MSQNSPGGQILHYKLIYSMTGLVLGLFTMISGFHLLTVDAFHLNSTSWEVNIFGFAITQNDNNLAPGIVFFLVGLFVIYSHSV